MYYSLTNSKNAILVEKAKCLKYSKKYYSYVLVVEDEQQPELVGKVMIFQYGKTIKDKISSERTGEISGVPCSVFDLAEGKDFVLVVKEIQTQLKNRGFDPGPIDGDLGPKTLGAMKSYLSANTTPVKEAVVARAIPVVEKAKDVAKAVVEKVAPLPPVPEIDANCFALEGARLTAFMRVIASISVEGQKLTLGSPLYQRIFKLVCAEL